jgi:hypothetical protein
VSQSYNFILYSIRKSAHAASPERAWKLLIAAINRAAVVFCRWRAYHSLRVKPFRRRHLAAVIARQMRRT